MRTSRRFAFPAVLGALLLSGGSLFANSASAPLRVSVTVVRSCAVRATSVARGAAHLDLNCSSGAASGVRRPGGLEPRIEDSRTRLRLQMPTTPSTRVAGDHSLEVVAVDF
jgi:hypothetical protein